MVQRVDGDSGLVAGLETAGQALRARAEVAQADLRARHAACIAAGDESGLFAVTLELAAAAMVLGAPEEAMDLLGAATPLLHAEAHHEHGQVERVAGHALRELARRGVDVDPTIAWDAAATYFRRAGDRVLRWTVLQEAAKWALDTGDHEAALDRMTALIAELEAGHVFAGVMDCLVFRATVSQGSGDAAAALDDLDRAAGLAAQLGLEGRAVQLLAQRGEIDGTKTDWEELARRAEQVKDVHTELKARVAAARTRTLAGDSVGGEALASEAIKLALRNDDPTMFFAASVAVAEARDAQANHPGVIDALLGAKATLEKALGADSGAPAVALLNELPHRWGDAAFQTALKAYREMGAQRVN